VKSTKAGRKDGNSKKGHSPTGASPRNYGLPLPGVNDEEFGGSLIVIEGMDGSGRSTQISLLTEWLESEGFAVETMGLRRSGLVAKDIDALLAENTITRMTLTLMYATDFYDQLEHRIIPALRSDFVVLADRYFYTLIARAVARGIERDYLNGLYEMAVRPDLTFWLNVRPEVAFEREFRKSHAISYWESGRDLSL
jgi:dTMP kinase